MPRLEANKSFNYLVGSTSDFRIKEHRTESKNTSRYKTRVREIKLTEKRSFPEF